MTIYSKRDLNARRKRALCLCASASAEADCRRLFSVSQSAAEKLFF